MFPIRLLRADGQATARAIQGEIGNGKHDVDIGEPSCGAMEHVEQIGPVHHRIGRAEALFDGLAQRQGLKRLFPSIGKDFDALGGEALLSYRFGKPQIVEHFPRVGADLKPGAEFGSRVIALKHHHMQAEFGQRQRKGQSGNACTGDVDCAGGAHGARRASGVFNLEHRAGRVGRAMGKGGAEDVERRAIGAHDLGVVTHIEEDMGVVERRFRADALEFLGADLNAGQSFGIVEVRGSVLCHESDHPAELV